MKKLIFTMFIYAGLFSANTAAVTTCNNQQILTSESCEGDAVDSDETTLYTLVNEYRAEKGLPKISLSPALSIVANRHVRDLHENIGTLTHSWSNCSYDSNNSETYSCMWEAPQRLGTSYPGNGYENAYGTSGFQVIPSTAFESWKKSDSHNDVILNLSIWKNITWKAIGVGIYKGYAVLWFGKATDKSAVIGAASETESTSSANSVLELYTAYFNRAADKKGFDFWIQSFQTYSSPLTGTMAPEAIAEYALRKIALDMSESKEYIDYYPSTQSASEFIEAIYKNILGRSSDSDGLAFWYNHLKNGTMSREKAILHIIAAVKTNSTTQGLADKALITNKTSFSKYFAETLGSNNIELAKSTFTSITDQSNSIVAAKAILDLALKTIDDEVTNGGSSNDSDSNKGADDNKDTNGDKDTDSDKGTDGNSDNDPDKGSNTKTLKADQQAVLDYHNKARADVNVKPLVWSDKVTKHAQAWSNHLATDNCSFKHSDDSNYGENLFRGTLGAYDMVSAAKSWESEKQDYSGEAINNTNYKIVGHYTQMVWSDSTEVGCATATCNNKLIVVCNYSPAGNYLGKKPY
jgi:uncharacterized protein YkwD